jgi:hypothetical protein
VKTKTQKNNPKKEKKNPTLGLEAPIRATFRQGSKAKLRSNSGVLLKDSKGSKTKLRSNSGALLKDSKGSKTKLRSDSGVLLKDSKGFK